MYLARDGTLRVVSRDDLDFVFFFTNHVDEADASGLNGLVRNADIVALESSDWDDEIKYSTRALARGETRPETYIEEFGICEENVKFSRFLVQLVNILYRSKTKIFFFDVPYCASDVVPKDRERDLLEMSLEPKIGIEERAKRIKRYFRAHIRGINYRDRWMSDSLYYDILKFINSPNRKFRCIPIRVVVVLGCAHVNVYRRIKSLYGSARRVYSHIPHVMTMSLEIIFRIMNRMEIPDLIALGSIAEIVISEDIRNILRLLNVNTQLQPRFIREFVYEIGERGIEESFSGDDLLNTQKILEDKFLKFISSAL